MSSQPMLTSFNDRNENPPSSVRFPHAHIICDTIITFSLDACDDRLKTHLLAQNPFPHLQKLVIVKIAFRGNAIKGCTICLNFSSFNMSCNVYILQIGKVTNQKLATEEGCITYISKK